MTNHITSYGYGLGSDGYIAIQKEISRENALYDYTNLKTMPVSFESYIKYYRENIENKNLLGKRLKNKNNLGFEKVEGQIILDAYPSLIGYLLSIVLGNNKTKSLLGGGVYEHTWEQIKDKGYAPATCMVHQAFGTEDPEQFNFCVLSGIVLECEKGNNLKMTFPLSNGQFDKTAITRRQSFIYPSEAPFNWSNIKIKETNFLQEINVHSFSLSIDLNYRKNEFFLGTGKEKTAYINGIPIITLSLNVDADKKYLDISRNNKYCNFEIEIENTNKISDSSITDLSQQHNYYLKMKLPSCQLNPETALEHSEERLTMDLEFDCSFMADTSSSSLFTFYLKDTNDNYL